MLMDLTRQLQESIDHLQITWLEKQDEIHFVSEARTINIHYHSYPYVIRLIISERPRGHQLS